MPLRDNVLGSHVMHVNVDSLRHQAMNRFVQQLTIPCMLQLQHGLKLLHIEVGHFWLLVRPHSLHATVTTARIVGAET